MESAGTPSKVAGKLETLPKEELLKFIKKQALNAKELKKAIDELREELVIEASENARLQEEKKEWLKQEISLEFEKKNKFLSKDNELQLAAKLGKEMLAENDDLHGEIEEMQREHEEIIQNFEEELDKLQFEKDNMAVTIRNLEEECATLHKEAMQYREELCLLKVKGNDTSEKEIKDLKETIKNLENELAASTSNSKVQQLKTKYDELLNTNAQNKEVKQNLDHDNKTKSEHILAMDAEMKNLRKEIAIFHKEQLQHNGEIEKVLKENALLKESIKSNQLKIEELDGEIHKLKTEKEKQSKSLKSAKTKLERASQMEEELKKQLNIIVGERDDLLKKQQKLVQKLKTKAKLTAEDDLYKEQLKDFSKQIADLVKENATLKLSNSDLIKVNEEVSQNFKSLETNYIKINSEHENQLTAKNKQEKEIETLKKEQKNGLINFQKLQDKFDDLLIERENLQVQNSQLNEDMKKFKASFQGKKKDRKKPTKTPLSKETQYFAVDEESASTILKLETRIEELLYQLQTLNEEKLNQEAELEELFKSHDDLQNKYDFECKEREKKENEILCLEERLERHEKEINNSDAETNFKLHQQIVQLNSNVSDLQSEIKKYQQEIIVKEEYIVQVRNEYEGISKKQAEIISQSVCRKEMDRVVEDFHQLNAELMATKCNLETSLQENNSLCLQLQELDRGFTAMKREYELSFQETQHLRLNISELSEEKSALLKDYENCVKKFTKLQEMYKKTSTVRTSPQENEITVSKQLLTEQISEEPPIECREECQSFSNLNELEEQETNSFNEENQKLTNKINILQHDFNMIEEKYRHLNDEYTQLKMVYKEIRKEKKEFQNNCAEMQSKLQIINTKNIDFQDSLLCFENLCKKLSCPGVVELEAYIDYLKEQIQTTNKESTTSLISEVTESFKAELEQLKNKNFELEENASVMILKLKEKDNAVLDLSILFKSLEEEKVNLLKDNEYLSNKIDRLNEELQKEKEEKQDNSLEKRKLIEYCEKLKSKVKESSKENKTLKIEVNKLQTDLSNLSEELSVLTEKYSLVSESTKKTTEQNSFLSEQCEILTLRLKEGEQVIHELTKNSESFQMVFKECEALKVSLSEFEEESCEKDKIIEELKTQLNTLNITLNEVKELLKEKENLFVKTDSKLNFYESINAKLESENHELSEKLKSIHYKNDSLLNDLKSEQKSSAELKVLLESFKGNQLSSVGNEELLEEIKRLKEENEFLSSESNKLNMSFVCSEEELQSALNRIEELESDVKGKSESKAQLENVIREANEKSSKFRNAAIKAKKELEVMKVEFEKEKMRLDELIKGLNVEMRMMKNEIVTQKTECSKHEEEFQLMQGEIKQLQDKLESEKQMGEDYQSENQKLLIILNQLTVASTTNEKEVARVQNLLAMSDKANCEFSVEIEKIKRQLLESEHLLLVKQKEIEEKEEEIDQFKKIVESLKKESDQINVMNLEINDYLKTTENLKAKLEVKQVEFIELQNSYQVLQETKESLVSDLATVRNEKKKMEDQSKKLKNLVMKLKAELSEERKKLNDNVTLHAQQHTKIEELQQIIDEVKLISAKLSAEKNKLQVELTSATESHTKSYKFLEAKHSRLSNDMTLLQRKHDDLQQEYESYKVRAHNVLKQQKNKQIDVEKEKQMQERAELEQMVGVLEVKLLEKEEQLNHMQTDYSRLEVEKDSLQTQYQQVLQESTQIESVWRKRNSQLSNELNAKILEYEKEIMLLKKENEYVVNLSKEEMSKKSQELEKYMKEIDSLKEQIKQSPVFNLDQVPSIRRKESDPKNELSSLDVNKSVLERQEGEGMDSKELEMISLKSSSLPQSPISPLSNLILENILSPSEIIVTTPSTPGGLREEIFSLRALMNSQMKKNEHVTALLRESEANSSRLDDQVKLLKDEIRRLERNVEREQALSNLEYLKNVIIKFLKVGSMEREQLIPVLCTMLKLSNEEKQFMSEYAKGVESESGNQGNTWTNYMYRWAGVS